MVQGKLEHVEPIMLRFPITRESRAEVYQAFSLRISYILAHLSCRSNKARRGVTSTTGRTVLTTGDGDIKVTFDAGRSLEWTATRT